MWPTQVSSSSPAARRWSDRGLRSRLLVIFGIVALLVGASIATWLSIRGGQPSSPPLYGAARPGPAALWTWDGAAYTTAYSGSYTEPNTTLTYQVLYSPSNGLPDLSRGNTTGWYYCKDNSQATPGVLSAVAANTTTSLTLNWDVSDTTRFPEANYLIRVEAYRANSATSPATPYKLHYSYHEFRAYISR